MHFTIYKSIDLPFICTATLLQEAPRYFPFKAKTVNKMLLTNKSKI